MTSSKKAVALKGPKAATKVASTAFVAKSTGLSNFFSLKTGKRVTAWYARRNPTKVVEGVDKLPKGAVIVAAAEVAGTPANPSLAKKVAKKAAKKTRVVKRHKSGKDGGQFAKKTARGGDITNDFVKAPKAAKKSGKALSIKVGHPGGAGKTGKKHVVSTAKVGLGMIAPIGMSAAAAKRAPKKRINIDLGKTPVAKAPAAIKKALKQVCKKPGGRKVVAK